MGYKKCFPSAPGLPPIGVSHPMTESQTASASQTFIPPTSMSAAMTYPIHQNELAMSMPDTGSSSLSYPPWDHQRDMHDSFLMHAMDGLGWAGSSPYSSEHDNQQASTLTNQSFSGLDPSFTPINTLPTYLDPEAYQTWDPATED